MVIADSQVTYSLDTGYQNQHGNDGSFNEYSELSTIVGLSEVLHALTVVPCEGGANRDLGRISELDAG